ncbi:MAG: NAD(P)-dependent glycerol-3-phosphate dehydrogenase [Verrucomicrobiales bacterium]|nr:NAD(P)-dependent glycerol-3-phosphate dehydrogenase [Verrucomicrobiales bacterium]
MTRVSVLGCGSWGTALAFLAAQRQAEVILWSREPAQVEEINLQRTNARYLPGIVLPGQIRATTNLAEAGDAEMVLFVVPSRAVRIVADHAVLAGLRPDAILLSCTKGIERDTGLRMSEILAHHFPNNPVAVLSGPNHAEEIVRGQAAAAVIGSSNPEAARQLQQFFTLPWFRTYTSDDVTGIEWGAAAKNVFAIAAGICEGLGLGDNAKAALLTRGLAEMVRLGVAEGGRPETFQGLSGIGDLIVTCFSRHSRNHRVGQLVGEGKTVAEISASMHMVAEGVPNAESIYLAARRHGVRTPIIDQVYCILHQGKPCASALAELLSRDLRAENS